MADRDLKSLLEDTFIARVQRSAEGLRVLADRIESEANRVKRVPTPGTPSASALAGNIMHSIMWGLANASTDAIVSAAAEYDFHLKKDSNAGS